MIRSAIQLKAKVRNVSHGNSQTAQAMIRVFFMERFLERVSISEYRNKFVLKSGMLISSFVGIDLRTTMDIDTTVKALTLTEKELEKIITEIITVPLEDNVLFRITDMETIMDDFDYPGIRIHLEGVLEKLKQPIKLDISTDDVITPGAVEYKYRLMFEEREISLNTYNIETLLAEKTQTLLNRGTANTRMRDFYDLYEIVQKLDFSWEIYRSAFFATCEKRETVFSKERVTAELENLSGSTEMELMWNRFRKKNHFVEAIEYAELMNVVSETIARLYEDGV